jgi:hypothetical protein
MGFTNPRVTVIAGRVAEGELYAANRTVIFLPLRWLYRTTIYCFKSPKDVILTAFSSGLPWSSSLALTERRSAYSRSSLQTYTSR